MYSKYTIGSKKLFQRNASAGRLVQNTPFKKYNYTTPYYLSSYFSFFCQQQEVML